MGVSEIFSYEEKKNIFKEFFSLPVLSTDGGDKLALISLICHLTILLKQKDPNMTHWKLLYQLNKKGNCSVPEEWLQGLSIVCAEFDRGCSKFPTFGLADKEIPKKITEMLQRWLPF